MPFQPAKTGDSNLAAPAERRVLVVDDDVLTLTMVGQMVHALGVRVDLASGATEAQRLVRSRRYALVLTDYQMPDVDGYELACWLKGRWKDTLVFVMTGCSPAEVADHRESKSVDQWIFKPFNLGLLRESLANYGLLGSP